MAHLRLALLGAFQASLDGRPLTHFASDKVRALLVYLAVEASHPHSREALASLLWPDWPQQKALYYLRNALSGLRKLLEEPQAETPFLWVTHDTLQFNASSDYWLDVNEFQRLTALPGTQAVDIPAEAEWMAGYAQAVDLYTGDFLESLSIDSLPFEEWALLKREGLHQDVLEALHRLGEYHLARGEYENAQEYARRQVRLEPWREEAYQQWMRALALAGQRSEALAQFETCCRKLMEELGVAPGTETVRLYESIRDGKLSPASLQKIKLHNLPAAVTSFIGREQEIAAILRLQQGEKGSRGCRLVTLTGAGGVGKTRLAIQTAAQLVNQFADGVWLVELAPVADPALVPAMTARSLGLREQIGPQVISLLQDYLEPRHLLLLLDNCEHLVEACAWLADTLLNACPNLSLLVTSREALGISGETVFYVPSLSLPDIVSADHEASSTSFEALGKYEATRLFLDRAGAATTGFTFTPTSAPAIAQICVRLDGIPLAIELAAACTRVLQVEEIEQRLDDRFQLLTGGSRTALPRYQTLRASIDWSYGLLSQAERMLLQRLSVFAGGWGLVAAEAVCSLPVTDLSSAASPAESVGYGEEIEACQVLQWLVQLVNKSLVTVEEKPGRPTRYHMLETIRQYAHEKLAESGQVDVVRDRHLQYFLELAERTKWALRGPEQPRWMVQLGTEVDNLRLALSWSLESGRPGWNPEFGLRLTAALWWFWHARGELVAGLQWIERLLAAEEAERSGTPLTPSRTQSRGEALMAAGSHALMLGKHDLAIQFCEEAHHLFLSLGEMGRRGAAYTLYELGGVASHQGDLQRAKRLMDESLAISRQEGDKFTEAEALINLGMDAMNYRDYEMARGYNDESLALRREIGDRDGEIGNLFLSGRLAFEQGQDERAREFFLANQQLSYDINNQFAASFPLPFLGRLEWVRGNYKQVAEYFDETLSNGRRFGDVSSIFVGLLSLGRLALSQGDYPQARVLLTESLAMSRKHDHQLFIALALCFLGLLAWAEGDHTQATLWYTEALEVSRRNHESLPEILVLFGLHRVVFAEKDYPRARETFVKFIHTWQSRSTCTAPWTIPVFLEPFSYLEAFAYLEIIDQKMERAARLLGATEAYHHRFQWERTPKERAMRAEGIACVREALGEAAFTVAWDEGRKLTLEQGIAETVRVLSPLA